METSFYHFWHFKNSVQGSEDGFMFSNLAFCEAFFSKNYQCFFLLLLLLDWPIIVLPLCFSPCIVPSLKVGKFCQKSTWRLGDTQLSQVTFSRIFLFEWNSCRLTLHLYLLSLASYLLLTVNDFFFIQLKSIKSKATM